MGAPDWLEGLESSPGCVRFGCCLNTVGKVGEEVEAGQALDFIDRDRVAREGFVRVGPVLEPEADG